MKYRNVFLLTFILLMFSFLLLGCWNYREVEDMNIVAGVAIDKGLHKEYMVSIEVIESSASKESPTTSRIIISEGNSVFDAVRNAIVVSGKKLYWSHNKILILSKEVAMEGIVEILDWFHRDSETRSDVYILVSKENSAKEILEKKEKEDQVTSFNLQDILVNQKALSKAPDVQIWKITSDIIAEGIMAIAPSIELAKSTNNTCPEILGTALFKKDKLIGFLDECDTKYLLFLRNKIEGGLLNLNPENKKDTPTVTLEIFDSKTKIKPIKKDNEVEINVFIDTHAALAAIKGTKNYITDTELKKLEGEASDMIKANCAKLIKVMQSEYSADIFGFGAKTREKEPKLWRIIGNNWENVFEDSKVNINVRVEIKNTAMTSKPIKIGD